MTGLADAGRRLCISSAFSPMNHPFYDSRAAFDHRSLDAIARVKASLIRPVKITEPLHPTITRRWDVISGQLRTPARLHAESARAEGTRGNLPARRPSHGSDRRKIAHFTAAIG